MTININDRPKDIVDVQQYASLAKAIDVLTNCGNLDAADAVNLLIQQLTEAHGKASYYEDKAKERENERDSLSELVSKERYKYGRNARDARNEIDQMKDTIDLLDEDKRKLQKTIFNQGKALDNERARARQLGQELESEKAARTRDADYYLREWEPKRKPEDHGDRNWWGSLKQESERQYAQRDALAGMVLKHDPDVLAGNRPEDGARVEGAPEALTNTPRAILQRQVDETQWSRGFDQEAINTAAFTASDKYLHEKLVRLAEDCPHLTPVQSALVAAAADRMGVNVWPGERQLRQRPMPKGDLAEALYPEHDGYRVDCAVPQGWVDGVDRLLSEDARDELNELGGVAAQFVTVYDDKSPHGIILPVTRMGVFMMASLSQRVD